MAKDKADKEPTAIEIERAEQDKTAKAVEDGETLRQKIAKSGVGLVEPEDTP